MGAAVKGVRLHPAARGAACLRAVARFCVIYLSRVFLFLLNVRVPNACGQRGGTTDG